MKWPALTVLPWTHEVLQHEHHSGSGPWCHTRCSLLSVARPSLGQCSKPCSQTWNPQITQATAQRKPKAARFCATSDAAVQMCAVPMHWSAWASGALGWAAAGDSSSGSHVSWREAGPQRWERAEVLPPLPLLQPGGLGHDFILPAHTRACSPFPRSRDPEEQSFSGSLHGNSWLGPAGFRGICHHTHIKSQNVRGTKGRKQQERSHASIPSMQFPFTALDLKAPWQTSFSHFTPTDYGCGRVCVLLLIPSESPFLLDERSLLNWYFGSHHVMLAKC